MGFYTYFKEEKKIRLISTFAFITLNGHSISQIIYRTIQHQEAILCYNLIWFFISQKFSKKKKQQTKNRLHATRIWIIERLQVAVTSQTIVGIFSLFDVGVFGILWIPEVFKRLYQQISFALFAFCACFSFPPRCCFFFLLFSSSLLFFVVVNTFAEIDSGVRVKLVERYCWHVEKFRRWLCIDVSST